MSPATTMTEMLSASILAAAAGIADPSELSELAALIESGEPDSLEDDPSASATWSSGFSAQLAIAAAALEEPL